MEGIFFFFATFLQTRKKTAENDRSSAFSYVGAMLCPLTRFVEGLMTTVTHEKR